MFIQRETYLKLKYYYKYCEINVYIIQLNYVLFFFERR